jgi:hypothetical protein
MYMYMYPSTWCAVSRYMYTNTQTTTSDQNATNRTKRIKPLKNAGWLQQPQSMVPNACVRACVQDATRSSLPPENLPSVCLKARPRWHSLVGRLNRPFGILSSQSTTKKSGHAAELNRPADRIAMAAKANFLRVRATCLRLPSKVPPKGETRVVRRALRNLAKKALKSHWICRWRRTDRGKEEERCPLDLLLLTST